MYVCICNAVTESDIHSAVQDGVRDIDQLAHQTGCSTGCGCCAELAGEVLTEAMREQGSFLRLVAASASY
jgi:bacterioferritin-associated ferredoxin